MTDFNPDYYELKQVDEKNTILTIDTDNYIFHSPTLRIFKVNELSLAIIKNCKDKNNLVNNLKKRYSQKQIENDLKKLKKAGIFDSISNKKLLSYKKYNKKYDDPIDLLLLNVAHICNLACSYCYAGKGSYKKKSIDPLMSKDIALKAVNSFLSASNQNAKGKIIDFFGGEPLLNFNIIHEVIDYASEKMKDWKKRIPFGITTNGTLLTERIFNFLQEADVRIMISIDGDKEIHDKHRKTKNGQGSYQKIINNIMQYLPKRPDLFLARATISPDCLDIQRITKHLNKLGFKEYSFAIDYCGCEEPFQKWSSALLKEYDKYYGYYIADILGRLLNGERIVCFHIFEELKRLSQREIHVIPCQMARGILVVTPKGDYFPCQRLTEVEEYRIGSVDKGIDQKKRKKLYPKLVYEKMICNTCWARYLCGGGCPAASFMERGDDKYPDKWNCQSRLVAWKWIVWLYLQLKKAHYPLEIMEKSNLEAPLQKKGK